jgi:quaternary ammonium compound-resistance protein SugE
MSIYWIVLFCAVIVEIAWALSMKWVYMQPGTSSVAAVVVLTILNILLLSWAMRGLPVGTAYAVWTGLGAVGVALFGVLLFKDPVSVSRFFFMALIALGVIGLKFSAA